MKQLLVVYHPSLFCYFSECKRQTQVGLDSCWNGGKKISNDDASFPHIPEYLFFLPAISFYSFQVSADSGISASPPSVESKIIPKKKRKHIKLKKLLPKPPQKQSRRCVKRTESMPASKGRSREPSSSKCSTWPGLGAGTMATVFTWLGLGCKILLLFN